MSVVADIVDRSLMVGTHQVICTEWVDINLCILGNRTQMSPEAVERKFRRLVGMGECGSWPPINGHWVKERFVVHDGRHEFIASLMLGREKVFVAWVESRGRERALDALSADAQELGMGY